VTVYLCRDAERATACVGVPADVAGAVSPVSVTVMLKALEAG